MMDLSPSTHPVPPPQVEDGTMMELRILAKELIAEREASGGAAGPHFRDAGEDDEDGTGAMVRTATSPGGYKPRDAPGDGGGGVNWVTACAIVTVAVAGGVAARRFLQ